MSADRIGHNMNQLITLPQPSNFHLLRGADVRVTQVVDDKKKNVAEIIVNDKFHHRFAATSRVSKHLDIMTPAELQNRLTGGSYFFIGDTLQDFRDGSYNGFVHTDETVSKFMDVLGYQHRDLMRFQHTRKNGDNDPASSNIVLRKSWSKNEISVPGYAQGADFTSELSFVWNPFVKTINSMFDLVREICDNGMVGMTSFLNTKVPLVNRFDEHLDIASRQIQNKVSAVMKDRMQTMAADRASVGDCLLIQQHVRDRLYSPVDRTAEENNRLACLLAAVSPMNHLNTIYQDGVFQDKNLASQLPAHLSCFDVFNIATEVRSHTAPCGSSSDAALDKFSNKLLFDREDNYVASASRATASRLSPFSGPEQAFFGVLH